MTINSGNHANNQLCMNYIFSPPTASKCVELIPLSIQRFPGTDLHARCVNERFYQLPSAVWDDKIFIWARDSSSSAATAAATGEAPRCYVPDDLHSRKSRARRHPGRLGKIWKECRWSCLLVLQHDLGSEWGSERRDETGKDRRRGSGAGRQGGGFGGVGPTVTWPVWAMGLLSRWWGPWGPLCGPDLW